MAAQDPLPLITAIRNSFVGALQVYCTGSCYNFCLILKAAHPGSTAYYSKSQMHVITKIGECFYDIGGLVDDVTTYRPLEEYIDEYDFGFQTFDITHALRQSTRDGRALDLWEQSMKLETSAEILQHVKDANKSMVSK